MAEGEGREALPHAAPGERDAESLPFETGTFDVVYSNGVLHHTPNTRAVVQEILRVLKPGGRIMILEITPPRSAVSRYVFRAYFEKVLPRVMRLSTGSADAELLLRYNWDTIAHCVPADAILDSLRSSGFVDVKHRARGGLICEYIGSKSP